MTAPPRVVLDTNIVLSALVFGGSSAGAVRRGWQEGLYTPLASKDTIEELMRALACPRFRLTAPEQEELLADYLPHVQVVHMPDPPPVVPACRDAFDVPFLQRAVAGRARWLVTGDRDLLALSEVFKPRGGDRLATLEAFARAIRLPIG